MPSGGTSGDLLYRTAVQQHVEQLLRGTPYHSLELPDGTIVPGLISIEALRTRIQSFPIPSDLSGRTVLDVGAASGWNSFEMLRRGAAVTAVDCVEFEELTRVRELFTPRIEYKRLDVDELTPDSIGTFDFVLFLGVLYHLRHPLLALERIWAVTKDAAFVESFVCEPNQSVNNGSYLEFYDVDQLGGQVDNWFGPTPKCLEAMCRSAGFVRVELAYVADRRAGLTCYRNWEPEPLTATAPAARLYSAVNNRTGDIYFHANKDEYICIYFQTAEKGLSPERMRIEVDGRAVNALVLADRGHSEWQVNCRVPPGLSAGEHSVRVRTQDSRFAGERTIVMLTPGDECGRTDSSPLPALAAEGPAPALIELANSLDRSTVFHGYSSERLCCRFTLAERQLSRDTVVAEFDGQSRAVPIGFLTDLGDGRWEANLLLPSELPDGSHSIRLRTLTGGWSEPLDFSVQRRSAVLSS